MENQTKINTLAETISDLLYALNKDLIQGPLYASLRMACDPEISNVDGDSIAYIAQTVNAFITETEGKT